MTGSQKLVVNNNPTIISDLLTEFQSTAKGNPESNMDEELSN